MTYLRPLLQSIKNTSFCGSSGLSQRHDKTRYNYPLIDKTNYIFFRFTEKPAFPSERQFIHITVLKVKLHQTRPIPSFLSDIYFSSYRSATKYTFVNKIHAALLSKTCLPL